mmetsp:Transcript_8474/g.28335  ORF Transcript_8474/g.28335 Transcript_8474/m.28335 type:complete len:363 (+) Transcript_8474:278-1366(+)
MATANDGASVATSLQNALSTSFSFTTLPAEKQFRSSGVKRTPRSASEARSSRARIFKPTRVSSSETGTLRNAQYPSPTSISTPAPAKRSLPDGTTVTTHASPDAEGRTLHDVYGRYSCRDCNSERCPSFTVLYVNTPFSTRTSVTPSVRHRLFDASHHPTTGSPSDNTRSGESRYDTVTGGAKRSTISKFGSLPVVGMGYGTRRTSVVSGVTRRMVHSFATSGSGGRVSKSKVRTPPMDSTGPRGFFSFFTGSTTASVEGVSSVVSSTGVPPVVSSVVFVSASTTSGSGFGFVSAISVSVCPGSAFSFSFSSVAGSAGSPSGAPSGEGSSSVVSSASVFCAASGFADPASTSSKLSNSQYVR